MACSFVKTEISYFLSRSLRVSSLLETQTLWHLQHWHKLLIREVFLCWNHPWFFLSPAPTYTPCSYHTGKCYFWNSVCQNRLDAPETSHAFSSVHRTSLAFLFVNRFPRVVRVFASPPWSQSSWNLDLLFFFFLLHKCFYSWRYRWLRKLTPRVCHSSFVL